MTNERDDTPPDFPSPLPLLLAERTAQRCVASTGLEIAAAAVAAEMRALMHDPDGHEMETVLAQQSQLLNMLFHRALSDGAGHTHLWKDTYSLNLALTAQRECRHTVEAASRMRARRRQTDMREEARAEQRADRRDAALARLRKAESGKQTDSAWLPGGDRGGRR
jgi:hypothetical protein